VRPATTPNVTSAAIVRTTREHESEDEIMEVPVGRAARQALLPS
jgi:hypothetical protein